MKQKQAPRFGALPALILVLAAACARFIPGMPNNFSPIGAMGLFAGAMLPLPYAAGISLLGLLLSDWLIGFYSPVAMLFVYLGTASTIGIGAWLARRGAAKTPQPLLGGALSGAVSFFILSNFGVWLAGGLYPMTLGGLIACFVAGIPFFPATLASSVVFTALLFGLYSLLSLLHQATEHDAH